MSHLLHRRRGHDSEDDDDNEESSVFTEITTDFDEDDSDDNSEESTTDDDNSEEEDEDEDEDEDEEEEEEEEEDTGGEDTGGEDTGEEVEDKKVKDKEDASDSDSEKVSDKVSDEEPDNETDDEQEKEVQGAPTAQDEIDQPPVTTTTQVAITTTTTTQVAITTSIDYQELQQQEKEKTIHELREYRRKLAEDPSFVPYVGLFWGHDNRYREDSLVETRESTPRFSPASASFKKVSYDSNLDHLMYKKWDHSGYEELLKLDEEDERRQREIPESDRSSQIDETSNTQRYNNGHNGYNGRGGIGSDGRGSGGGRGRGRGRGRGQGYGSGGFRQQQNRHDSFQKHPNEEWPQLATLNTESPTNREEQSFSDTIEKVQVNAWGSIDRAEEIEPMVESKTAADGWGALLTTVSHDGWGRPPANKSQPTTPISNSKDSWKNSTNAQEESSTANASNALGPLAEAVVNREETGSAPPADTESHTEREIPTSVPKVPSNNDGWGERPEIKDTMASSNWRSVAIDDNEKRATPINDDKSTVLPEQINTNQATTGVNTSVAEAPSTSTTDGWGHQEETSKAEDQTTPAASQWDAPASNNSNNDTREKGGWSQSSTHTKEAIPLEEKASSSWANARLDVEIHTTPSYSVKAVYTRSYNQFDSSRGNNHHQQEDAPKGKQKAVAVDQRASSVDAQTSVADWATSTPDATHTNGCNSAESVVIDSAAQKTGWGEAASTQPKSEDNQKVEYGWGARPAPEQSKTISPSWNTAETLNKPESSNWIDSTASFDHSNSSVRGGWNDSRPNNSNNWNTDREWNNKIRNNEQQQPQQQQQQQQQQPQHKNNRGYFSTRIEYDVPEPTTTPEGHNTPETSAWGRFQSTGDDDSDVEIILEAEAEPSWLKEDEQVLGMTAPGERAQSSHSPRMATRQHLQDDSRQSSPRAEANGHNSNSSGSGYEPRRNFEEEWHQQREEQETYRPMYYPAPHHSLLSPPPPPPPNQMNGNITYVPMMPNGNGNPMYPMPFTMGPSHSGGSANPLQGGESSNTSHPPHKYYAPSPSNPQQLPPGYEANGMVYYGMDPSALYPPPQPIYYYAPMMPNGEPYNEAGHAMRQHHQHQHQHQHQQHHHHAQYEEGWGPTPEAASTEEQWVTKSPQNDYENRTQPVNHYYYPQKNHHY